MGRLSPELKRQCEEIERVKRAVGDSLLARPDVQAVGIGFKHVGGRETDQVALRVYVWKKGDVPPDRRIPTTIRGVVTDVIQYDLHPHASLKASPQPLTSVEENKDTKKYDVLVGGISIGPSRHPDASLARGTLGLIVVDNIISQPLMLSNCHVMCWNDGKDQLGDLICQPSRVDNAIGYCSDCSQLYKWKWGDVEIGDEKILCGVDCAVAALTHRVADVGKIADLPREVMGTREAELGMVVFKRGCTTLLTRGTVDDISYDSVERSHNREVPMHKQIAIVGSDGKFFSDVGDSGSVIITDDQLVVGLLWGSSDARSVASPIAVVMETLNISIR